MYELRVFDTYRDGRIIPGRPSTLVMSGSELECEAQRARLSVRRNTVASAVTQ